jgi:succinate dehydrogenase/fumarate reductase flavoprotein subunit
MLQGQIIETDVLVVGAGIAGIRAAVEAYDQGANVVLANKGLLGKDGAAVWMAGWGYQAAMYPPDSLEQHVKDTIRGGKFLNDQEQVYEFLKLAPMSLEDLHRWGVRLAKKEGRFPQAPYPGHTYARSVHHAKYGEFLGGEFRKALPRQIRLREGIKVLEDMPIIDLLKTDNTVVGALLLDVREGEFTVIRAKSTILATGGIMACWEFTTANPTLSGDGHGAAYRAGARMMDMEFMQFLPNAALWPRSVRGDAFPYSFTVMFRAHFYNRIGERFLERYYPVEKDFATREAVSRAIFREVREGRGSPHGGAYLSLRHLPRNLIDEILEPMKQNPFLVRLREEGIDLRWDAIEVGPGAHYYQGGCRINKKCETSLEGLYAIGEASGGRDGADRLPGNSLPFCMAMGYIAGKEAAARAESIGMPRIDENQVKELCAQTVAPIERSDGIRGREVKSSIRNIMSSYLIYERKEDELKVALKEVEKIRDEMLPQLWSKAKGRRFNVDWLGALEARNMVDVSEMLTRSALMRKESRGLHERADYPNEDPAWLKHIIVENVKGRMTLSTKPVTFPYLKPK